MDLPTQRRALVFISDLHLGSDCSILQPDFLTEKAQPIGQTPLAAWLWNCWQIGHAWLNELLPPQSYGLVINGDCIEGNHHRTTEIWSPDTRNHVKAAKELLKPVADRAGKVFMVKGTECHVNGSENSIAEYLGAEVNPEHGQPFWQNLRLDFCGRRISVRHHFPATSRSYLEASQYSIQLGNAVNEAVRAGDRAPDIIVGAHRHRTGHFIDGNRLAVVTGAWQGLTNHGFKVVPDGVACPSIYVLDSRNVEDGEMPVVHYRRFNPPPAKAVSL
jgi:UDP-2,3-diacylglucosamine pyrophosphatase LpxH